LAVRLVSEVMGGAVEVDRQHDFLWELHLSELRYELQSNIIPIGQIRKGTYYHRALLYKVGSVLSLSPLSLYRSLSLILVPNSSLSPGVG
jgi:hypothetical protein